MISLTRAKNRPGLKICAKCGGKFEKEDRIVVTEEQISIMRGDDICTAYHILCAPPLNSAIKQSQEYHAAKTRQHTQS